MDPRDKGVFLTGGAKGIGRAVVEALLSKGARVLFCDLNGDAGKAVETELQKQYGADNVIFVKCDVTDRQQLQDTFEKAVSSFGAVEICINNAGILDERMWEQAIAINTTAQIRGSQLAVEHMRRDKGGRGGVIINTASRAGLITKYWHPVYSATKHAIIGFTQSWAANPDLVKMGVRWACVCPGAVDTDLYVQADSKVLRGQEYQAILDSKHFLTPEVVAEGYMKLVQDEKSNGAILTVWEDQSQLYSYKRRQLVDEDGVSNPIFVDSPVSM